MFPTILNKEQILILKFFKEDGEISILNKVIKKMRSEEVEIVERIYNRKVLNACESLLFGNIKFTFRNFIRRCDKQNIKILGATVQRLVAFLQSLPKNYALFQALEPAFIYIIQEQFLKPKEDIDVYQKLEKLGCIGKKIFILYSLCGII